MKCSFCGNEFDENQKNAAGCQGCPMSGHCGKIKCPRCGYEMPKPIGWFQHIMGRRKAK